MIQELENEIRSKLPHTMELSAGCEFTYLYKDKVLTSTIILVSVAERNDCTDLILFFDEDRGYYEEFVDDIKDFKTIGHPINLANVLEWLKGLQTLDKSPYYINVHGEFMTSKNDFIAKWNNKNLLREQSTELIDSLFNLIEKR
jgi:hypothetical protein